MNKLIPLRPEVTLARLDLMIANKIGNRDINEEVKIMVQLGELEGYENPDNPLHFTIGTKDNVEY